MKPKQIQIIRSGLLAAAVCLLALGPVGTAHAVFGGTTTDAWDVSGGTIVTGSSGFAGGGIVCGTGMFGATNTGCASGEGVGGNTLFRDNAGQGSIHSVEWQTTSPVAIESFDLSAYHDNHTIAPASCFNLPTFRRDANHRGFSRFTLKAFNTTTSAFDIILYDMPIPVGDDNAVHGAGKNASLYDPEALLHTDKMFLNITANVTPVSTNRWRAEFVQFGCGPSPESGPRIVELDGFGPSVVDTDSDGIPDDVDNCPADANPLQENNDGDAFGDLCDPDDDNDSVLDVDDNCPTDPNPLQEDFDLDGLGNVCDPIFDADSTLIQIEALVLEMRALIVSVDPPGGNGMIAKLTGKGGVLAKVGNAVVAFGLGLIDLDTYVSELQDALAKVTAFYNQLAAKIDNGQIPVTQGSQLSNLSVEIRDIIENLITAAGG